MKRVFILFIGLIISSLFFACLNPVDFKENAAIVDTNIARSSAPDTDLAVEYYQYWSNKYLKSWDGSDSYYYVDQSYDFEQGYITGAKDFKHVSTSEAMGYGMLITSVITPYLSGEDKQDAKKYFDGLYRLYKKMGSTINLPDGSPSPLMSWVVPKYGTDGYISDSATDGDIDIAYSLLVAHKNWGSDGEINYIKACEEMIKAISLMEFDLDKNITLLGDWVYSEKINKNSKSRYKYASRPCDWMGGKLLDLYEYFSSLGVDIGYDMQFIRGLDEHIFWVTNRAGLTPDFTWIDYLNGGDRLSPVPGGRVFNGKSKAYEKYSKEESDYFIESENDNSYFWNSCRFPMRMSYMAKRGFPGAKAYIYVVADRFYSYSNGSPENICSGYNYYSGQPIEDGGVIEKGNGAFVSPIIVAVKTTEEFDSQKKNEFLQKGLAYWNSTKAKSDYYSDSITLQAMMIYSDMYSNVLQRGAEVDEWQVGVSYSVGDKVRYNGSIWTCTFSHTSNSAWYPGAPGLWFWEKNN